MEYRIFLFLFFLVLCRDVIWESEKCKKFDKSTCPQITELDENNESLNLTHQDACPPPRKLYQKFNPNNPCCPKVNKLV